MKLIYEYQPKQTKVRLSPSDWIYFGLLLTTIIIGGIIL